VDLVLLAELSAQTVDELAVPFVVGPFAASLNEEQLAFVVNLVLQCCLIDSMSFLTSRAVLRLRV